MPLTLSVRGGSAKRQVAGCWDLPLDPTSVCLPLELPLLCVVSVVFGLGQCWAALTQYPRLAEVSSNRLWREMRVRTGAHPQHDFAATACISSDVAPICNAVIAVEPWSVHDEPQKGITNKSTIYYRGGNAFQYYFGDSF